MSGSPERHQNRQADLTPDGPSSANERPSRFVPQEVTLDRDTIARLAAEGLGFRRDIERRARLMTIPSPRGSWVMR